MRNKKDIIENVDALIKSCEQGLDGSWDCSCDEGKRAFNDMITLLEEVKDFLNKKPRKAKKL